MAAEVDHRLRLDPPDTIHWPARDLRPGMIVVGRLPGLRVASPIASIERSDATITFHTEHGHPDLSVTVDLDGTIEVVRSEIAGF